MATSRALTIAGVRVLRGETRDVRLKISETYTGDAVTIPLRVVRGPKAGPTVFVTAAVHGDELNGTGIVHDLMFDQELKLKAGTLLLAPVDDDLDLPHVAAQDAHASHTGHARDGRRQGQLGQVVQVA